MSLDVKNFLFTDNNHSLSPGSFFSIFAGSMPHFSSLLLTQTLEWVNRGKLVVLRFWLLLRRRGKIVTSGGVYNIWSSGSPFLLLMCLGRCVGTTTSLLLVGLRPVMLLGTVVFADNLLLLAEIVSRVGPTRILFHIPELVWIMWILRLLLIELDMATWQVAGLVHLR